MGLVVGRGGRRCLPNDLRRRGARTLGRSIPSRGYKVGRLRLSNVAVSNDEVCILVSS